MAEPLEDAPRAPRRGPMSRLRPWLRAMHRDAGYLAVGLTVVYAVSGLAVNHLTDFEGGDASFRTYSRTVELGSAFFPIEGTDAAHAALLRERLAVREEPTEVYRPAEDEIEVLFDNRTLHANLRTGAVIDEGKEPRFFLRAANWLHLNRGKKAWTYVADSYAVALLVLAMSGLAMIPGRKGFLGRGVVLALVGAAVPVAYVVLSGGP